MKHYGAPWVSFFLLVSRTGHELVIYMKSEIARIIRGKVG